MDGAAANFGGGGDGDATTSTVVSGASDFGCGGGSVGSGAASFLRASARFRFFFCALVRPGASATTAAPRGTLAGLAGGGLAAAGLSGATGLAATASLSVAAGFTRPLAAVALKAAEVDRTAKGLAVAMIGAALERLTCCQPSASALGGRGSGMAGAAAVFGLDGGGGGGGEGGGGVGGRVVGGDAGGGEDDSGDSSGGIGGGRPAGRSAMSTIVSGSVSSCTTPEGRHTSRLVVATHALGGGGIGQGRSPRWPHPQSKRRMCVRTCSTVPWAMYCMDSSARNDCSWTMIERTVIPLDQPAYARLFFGSMGSSMSRHTAKPPSVGSWMLGCGSRVEQTRRGGSLGYDSEK